MGAHKSNNKQEPAVRPAMQKRSAATRDAILNVVEKMVVAGEFETATVQDIVREAGSSVGAFYGRFADKSAVLFSFYDARCQGLEVRVAEILENDRGAPLWSVLSRFVGMSVLHTMDNEPFLRVSQKHFTGDPQSPFTRRARQLNSRLYAMLRRLLDERRAEHAHPEPETAALFVLALVGGLTRDALLTGQKISNRDMYAEAFLGELKRAVAGYLGIEP
jgi:AcrR family transcriptional regulator